MTPEQRVKKLKEEHGVNTQLFFLGAFIESEIRAAVAEEREACAKVADVMARHPHNVMLHYEDVAASIRARTK